MNWAILGVLAAILFAIEIVNATRIERLRSDLDNSSGKVTLPETESMLVRGEIGERLPKKAYWVNVHPDPNPSSDEEELVVDRGDDSQDTDGTEFDTDVMNSRIKYVYRADQRVMFEIKKESGRLIVTPVSPSSAVRFAMPGSGPKKMTLIGLPEALVTATASSS